MSLFSQLNFKRPCVQLKTILRVSLILTEFFSNNCNNFSIVSRHFESSMTSFCATWNWRDDKEARKFDAVAIFSNEICKWRQPVKNDRLPTILNLRASFPWRSFRPAVREPQQRACSQAKQYQTFLRLEHLTNSTQARLSAAVREMSPRYFPGNRAHNSTLHILMFKTVQ